MSIFVDIDPGTIVPQLVQDFEDYLGVVLGAGDQRREFLQGFGYALTTALQTIEATGEKELLETSFGQYLDKLGALVGVERRPAAAATCTVQFTLSNAQPQAVTVPQGTRVTPDGALFFATTETLVIASGQTSGTVLCEATEPGAQYNGYLPGQISQLVDGVSYVAAVSNTTESGGGADIEDDDSYRERIRMAPLAFSTAGPSGAYEYFALSADPSVGDVYVVRMSPGVVGIYVVKTGGVIPETGDPVLQAVLDACDDKTRRPLTDNVQVMPAVASNTSRRQWPRPWTTIRHGRLSRSGGPSILTSFASVCSTPAPAGSISRPRSIRSWMLTRWLSLRPPPSPTRGWADVDKGSYLRSGCSERYRGADFTGV